MVCKSFPLICEDIFYRNVATKANGVMNVSPLLFVLEEPSISSCIMLQMLFTEKKKEFYRL